MNSVQIIYTCECKCKNVPVETVSGIRGGGMKESRRRCEFKHDIFDTF
jgi:hypothetical protein